MLFLFGTSYRGSRLYNPFRVIAFCVLSGLYQSPSLLRAQSSGQVGLLGKLEPVPPNRDEILKQPLLLRNLRAQGASISPNGLTFEFTVDFEKPQEMPLSNRIYVRVGGPMSEEWSRHTMSEFWVSTHDLRSAQGEGTGTVKCTVIIGKFKAGKTKSLPVALVIEKMARIRYDPGQTSREPMIPRYEIDRIWRSTKLSAANVSAQFLQNLSNIAITTLTLP